MVKEITTTAKKNPAKPSAKQQRERKALIHRLVRFAIQVVFFILAPGAWAAAFNGVKYICTQLGYSEPISMTAFVLMLIGLLAFTIVAGRFFCGYACAFGTLGDVLFGVFDFIRSKTPIPRLVFPDRLVKVLSLLKYVILAAICLMCFFGVWTMISGYSPWVSFAGLVGGSIEGIAVGSFIALGLVALLMIVRERAFCEFLCPMGAVFALMPVLPFSQFRRNPKRCPSNCGRCHANCPVTIWPDPNFVQGECIACGRCVDVCPLDNIDLIALDEAPASSSAPSAACATSASGASPTATSSEKTPSRKATMSETLKVLRGNEIALVVAKAVVLLVILWLVHGTRFLPTL